MLVVMVGCVWCVEEQDIVQQSSLPLPQSLGAATVARAATAAVCGYVVFYVLSFVTCGVQIRVCCTAFKCCESLSCIST